PAHQDPGRLGVVEQSAQRSGGSRPGRRFRAHLPGHVAPLGAWAGSGHRREGARSSTAVSRG
ncbi:unnamed protein product, partial [Durusdinium trenchii]